MHFTTVPLKFFGVTIKLFKWCSCWFTDKQLSKLCVLAIKSHGTSGSYAVVICRYVVALPSPFKPPRFDEKERMPVFDKVNFTSLCISLIYWKYIMVMYPGCKRLFLFFLLLLHCPDESADLTFTLFQTIQDHWKVEVTPNLVPRSHSVTGNVRSGKVRQYTLFHWLLKKRLRQCNLRSDLLISWGTSVKVK